MIKHTPGPWEFRQEKPWTIFAAGRAIMGNEVYYPWTPENIADWLLIAAAPELLEALVMVRDADEDCKRDGLPTIPPAARAKIDAAIAKAEGT